LTGTATYAAVSPLLRWLLRTEAAARTQLIDVGDVSLRVHQVGAVLFDRLLLPEPTLPLLPKVLLLTLPVLVVLQLGWRAWPSLSWRRLVTQAGVAALMAAACVWTLGLWLVLDRFWPALRTLSHVSVLWAGILVIAYRAAGVVLRRLLLLLVVLIVVSFIGADNRILADQQRVNRRDAALANRIVARLEGLPGFPQVEDAVLVGGEYQYAVRVRSQDLDMNISAFGAAWAKTPLLREVSGYAFGQPRDEAVKTQARAYCESAAPWPAEESVTILDRVAIVCLAGPR
jgi:hypothetical protein